ncbi:MAG: hypothetical protein AAF384_09645 [Pseudomonadota bacterium]
MSFKQLSVLGLLVFSINTVAADDGHGFRQAAVQYDEQAKMMIEKAAYAGDGESAQLLKIGAIYQEMAAIKRNAAKLAEQERWNEINWTRYEVLDADKEAILAQLRGGKAHAAYK